MLLRLSERPNLWYGFILKGRRNNSLKLKLLLGLRTTAECWITFYSVWEELCFRLSMWICSNENNLNQTNRVWWVWWREQFEALSQAKDFFIISRTEWLRVSSFIIVDEEKQSKTRQNHLKITFWYEMNKLWFIFIIYDWILRMLWLWSFSLVSLLIYWFPSSNLYQFSSNSIFMRKKNNRQTPQTTI